MDREILSAREYEMHQRLHNWGIAMRGGYPNGQIPDLSRPEPDLLDADIIEAGMCAMRRDKQLHYRILRWLYLRDRSTVEASNYFRKTEVWTEHRLKEGLAFLIRHVTKDLQMTG